MVFISTFQVVGEGIKLLLGIIMMDTSQDPLHFIYQPNPKLGPMRTVYHDFGASRSFILYLDRAKKR